MWRSVFQMQPPQVPPYYVLCRSTLLTHPNIQYHYADDNPLALLPHNNEHVLLLDLTDPPTVQSISPDIAVTALKIEEAPGAAAEGDPTRNDRMYIIETTLKDRSMDSSTMGERKPPHIVLAQFKQRNAVLRRALLYPENPGSAVLSHAS
ncbi:hypothetical protein C8J57DRAFT_1268647 [Mycena rebaudengoi]|nr:hypothetical protein C8J57DRAFT_1268647 [Mycena rebaudengoi]